MRRMALREEAHHAQGGQEEQTTRVGRAVPKRSRRHPAMNAASLRGEGADRPSRRPCPKSRPAAGRTRVTLEEEVLLAYPRLHPAFETASQARGEATDPGVTAWRISSIERRAQVSYESGRSRNNQA